VKLCMNCAHHVPAKHPEAETYVGELAKCARSTSQIASPVTGVPHSVQPSRYTFCAVIRESTVDTECGPDVGISR